MNQNKELITAQKQTIYQRESLVDKTRILFMNNKADTVTKNLKTYEAVEYLTFYKNLRNNPETKNKYNVFSLLTQWAIQKNTDLLLGIVKPYIDFSEEKQKELIEKYVSEGKTHTVQDTQTDENGNEKMVDMTQVKEEFLPEFQNDYDELQNQLNTLLYQENELLFSSIDLDTEIRNCKRDTDLNMDDLEFLNLFNKSNE